MSVTVPHTKAARHALVVELLTARPVHSQQQLAELLDGGGRQVTQATLSRDLVELGAVKIRDAVGGAARLRGPAEGGGAPPRARRGGARPRSPGCCAELLVTAEASRQPRRPAHAARRRPVPRVGRSTTRSCPTSRHHRGRRHRAGHRAEREPATRLAARSSRCHDRRRAPAADYPELERPPKRERTMTDRVVLAYSGGLDTSVAIGWIAEETGAEVIAVRRRRRPGRRGPRRHPPARPRLRRRRGRSSSTPATSSPTSTACPRSRPNALYMDRYPLVSALSRPMIVKHLVARRQDARRDHRRSRLHRQGQRPGPLRGRHQRPRPRPAPASPRSATSR